MKLQYVPAAIEKRCYTAYMKVCAKTGKHLNVAPRDKQIIVSLTSFPARFEYLYLVIESIFRQTVKPDRICLYLDEGIDKSSLPTDLLNLEKYGLEIKIGGAQIKPHKKYYYAMQENPDSIIITVDDDHIYRRNVIEKLMSSYARYPHDVSCMRAHRIQFNPDHSVKAYNDWDYECRKYIMQPRMDLIATGIGAVLYPPHCLPKDTFDIKEIQELSLAADDIWLKVMEMLNGTKVVAVEGKKVNPISVDTIDVTPLASQNVNESKNDVYLKNLIEKYGIDLYKMIAEENPVD